MDDYSYFYEMLKEEKIIENSEQLTKSFESILLSNIKKYPTLSESVGLTIMAFCPTKSNVQLSAITATLNMVLAKTNPEISDMIDKEIEEDMIKFPGCFKKRDISVKEIENSCREDENLK